MSAELMERLQARFAGTAQNGTGTADVPKESPSLLGGTGRTSGTAQFTKVELRTARRQTVATSKKPAAHINPVLPAHVRQRFTEACKGLDLDPAPVLRQFDRWRYTEADLTEMSAWPTSTVMQHCLLLASEVAEGMKP